MRSNYVNLVLKCGSRQEAERIADSLLEMHLVACVEFQEVKSKYHWQGQVEEANEVKLVMETIASNFDKVEAEVAKLHSYDTFVLQQLPIERVSQEAQKWWRSETQAKG